MGNQGQKPVAQKASMEDNIIDIKIQCKTLQRSAKKAQKQAATYQKKAKEALKKNNQQGAKMYLMSAASKTKEAQSCERTAMKMQFMCGQIKTMKNNEQFMNSFSNLTYLANQQMNNFDATKMAQQMQMFNTKMDEMMINGKMMTQIMDSNQMEHGNTVQQMKKALQQQINMQEQNKMQEQQQIQFNKQKAEGDKFIDQLKDL